MSDHRVFSGLDNLSWLSSVAAITARVRLLVVATTAIVMVVSSIAWSDATRREGVELLAGCCDAVTSIYNRKK